MNPYIGASKNLLYFSLFLLYLFAGKFHPHRLPAALFNDQHRHGDLLAEPPRTAAARIKPQSAFPYFLRILMGMTKDNDLPVAEIRRKIPAVMNHGKLHAA